ncbi:hypothetical protein Trydic_g9027 [Trypoxylus dichotomus]
MKSLFVIIFCGVLSRSFTVDLPSYITPCSLKDPALSECIKNEANAAIPTVVKGEPLLRLPVLSPLVIPELAIGGANLQIKLTDLRNDDLKDLRFSATKLDFANKRAGFVGFVDKFTVLATYSIKDGKIGSRSVSGSGKFNMTLVGNTIDYKCDVDVVEKDGEQYLQIVDPTLVLTIERAYYSFENLRSSSGGDANAYVEKNWRLLTDELKSSLDKIFKNLLTETLGGVTAYVPMREPLLGLPVLSPLVIPKLDIGGANLQIKLTDLRNDDLKKLRFSKALFDFANTKGGFVGFIDKVTVLATYSIKNGRIGSRSVSGSGKFNMTLIKNTMDYKCDVAVTEKDGEQHLYIPKSTLDLTVERAYYYFENLRLSSGGNANAYVDKNWSLVRAELKPSLDKFFKNFLTTTLTNLGATIPMRKLFKV